MTPPSKIERKIRRRRISRLIWIICAVALFAAVTFAAYEVYKDYEQDAHTGTNHDQIVLTPH